ncbi:MAG: DUF2007 domain-containing protein [Syntrophomonadaceae bacterium]|nr:DUF2007 domain-containing protein [Syntrophomonadaceae bacterium]
MLCRSCHCQFADGIKECPDCRHPVPVSWKLLKTVYPPEDTLIKGFLESCGIPVIIRQRESIGRVQGLSFGPLAEVMIMVPEETLQEAKLLIDSESFSSDTH